MQLDLAELLDPELKGPIKTMLRQMPLMSFNDLPAARAASQRMMAAMKMPDVPGVKSEDRSVPGPAGCPAVRVRIYRPDWNTGLSGSSRWTGRSSSSSSG